MDSNTIRHYNREELLARLKAIIESPDEEASKIFSAAKVLLKEDRELGLKTLEGLVQQGVREVQAISLLLKELDADKKRQHEAIKEEDISGFE